MRQKESTRTVSRFLAVMLCVIMAAFSLSFSAPVRAEGTVEEIVSGMTLDEKISQMIIPAVRSWNGTDVSELYAADGLAEALQRHQYGGIILFGQNVKGTEQFVRLVSDLQKNNAQIEATTSIPYFIPLDEEGGIVTRLSMGTRMTGSMAIGATGDSAYENALITGTVIGEELNAMGANVDFAPDADVNCNPANPVIGTRSFSDDPDIVANLAPAFTLGLASTNTIGCYKHFPGHGDTGTDSHIGTATVNKTYEQLQETELVPFYSAITYGADMIMTAHITLPLVDDPVEFADGTVGYYPATMSKKVITDILRGDLGYDGVVVTDALEMAAIAKAKLVDGEEGSVEYGVNIAEKVINAGVDILLLPVDLNTPAVADYYDEYIDGLTDKVNSGVISMERIDESVLRILRLKDKYGILWMDTSGSNVEEAVANAKQVVGSDAHHTEEMDIALSAITLVKNDADTLPISGKKIALVGRNKNDTVSIGYSVNLLQQAGLIPEDAFIQNIAQGTSEGSPESDTRITIDYYFDSASSPVRYTEELKKAVAEAEDVAVVSVSSGTKDLSATAVQYQAVSSLIRDTHSAGGKFILLSSNLPYDSARYQDADAILIAYMNSGTGVDPTDRTAEANAGAYNANMIASMGIAFGSRSPSGALPVNVPEIVENEDGTISYTDQVLYERGFRMTYREENPITVTPKDAVSLVYSETSVKKVTPDKLMEVNDAVGTLSYKLVSADKNKDSFYVGPKTGKVWVAEKTPAGTYKLKIRVTASGDEDYKKGSRTVEVTIKITKKKNTITVQPESKPVSYSSLQKQTKTFRLKAETKENAKTSFELLYVKERGAKYISVSSDGTVTLRKGLPKGTYKLTVGVTAKKTSNYKETTVKKTITVIVE